MAIHSTTPHPRSSQPQRPLLSAARAAAALLLLSAACGDDDGPKLSTRRDAGDRPDASEVDAAVRDSGMPKDTGTPDEGLVGSCAIDSNKIYSVKQQNQPFVGTPLAVDPAASMFALPFVGPQAGCLDVVNMTLFKGSSTGGDPTTTVASDHCGLIKDAATAALQGHWLVATIDSRDPPFDVWLQRYDSSQGEQGAAVRLSTAPAVETALAIGSFRNGEHALVAWGDEETAGVRTLYTRVVDAGGAPVGDAVKIQESTDLFYRGLSVAPLGTTGAALAYWRYNEDFTTSEIVFRALDAMGAPTRDEWVLAVNAGPSPSVDVATDAMLGGIVWSRAEGSQGRQVWFQRIDASGQAAELLAGPGRSPALRIVNSPFRGIDVSVAKLLTGYVLSYRSLPAAAEPRAEIRLYFLDRNGAVIGDSDVSYTSASGGRTAVEAAYDGRVVIGWSQVNEDGKSELKLVRLPCIGG
ncbi:MAG TPA: hypothetical protein VFG30_32410 [Polyangiales bacterium]|nr:hypothetical protein [Polyangiales bacterium]